MTTRKRFPRAVRSQLASVMVPALVVTGWFATSCGYADDGLDRLLKKANVEPTPADIQTNPDVACANPPSVHNKSMVKPVGHVQQFHFTDTSGFDARGQCIYAPSQFPTKPLDFGEGCFDPERHFNPWHPHAGPDEFVFDGDDQGKPVAVDRNWNVTGLDIEDTVGHFDTLDGRRLVAPSNRVAIYAPRFGAVRRVDGLINAESRTRAGAVEEQIILARSEATDVSSTTLQQVPVDRMEGRNRASGLINRTRGVPHETVTHLFGIRNQFKAFENLSLIKFGKHSNAQNSRLELGIQSANVWEDDLGLQVSANKVEPIIVNDVYRVQQIVTIETDDKKAVLRVCKLASKIAARPGEEVDFTIRFDNLTGRKIGNVTIIDNLTRRLEYVPESAECSLKADFVPGHNEAGSLMLRWEIVNPLDPNEGGIIRFRCRVR